MTTRLLALALVAAASPALADDLPAPVAMDGPVADVCKSLVPAGNLRCSKVTTTQIGPQAVAVFLVEDGANYPDQRAGDYVLAVRSKRGWLVAHEPLRVPPSWHEHGPSHTLIAMAPRLRSLSLASGRPAVAVDVPIVDVADQCGDRMQVEPPPPDCNDKARARVKATIRKVRAHPRVPTNSPVAVTACGQREDGTWACIPPITTASSHSPLVRFQPDGTLELFDHPASF